MKSNHKLMSSRFFVSTKNPNRKNVSISTSFKECNNILKKLLDIKWRLDSRQHLASLPPLLVGDVVVFHQFQNERCPVPDLGRRKDEASRTDEGSSER